MFYIPVFNFLSRFCFPFLLFVLFSCLVFRPCYVFLSWRVWVHLARPFASTARWRLGCFFFVFFLLPCICLCFVLSFLLFSPVFFFLPTLVRLFPATPVLPSYASSLSFPFPFSRFFLFLFLFSFSVFCLLCVLSRLTFFFPCASSLGYFLVFRGCLFLSTRIGVLSCDLEPEGIC